MNLYEAAKAEQQALEAQLAEHPLFLKLEAVKRVVALYSSTLLVPSDATTPKRSGTQAAIAVAAAEKYLAAVKHRAQSMEITQALMREGIQIDGKKPNAVLASYLSNSPLFDNVRGEGYGLKAWKNPPLVTATHEQAADTIVVSAAA